MEFIRPKKASLSLDMAPLIDIVFQLLIFFMLSSSFLNPSLKLNLPQAVQQDQRETERIVISMDKGGSVYMNTLKTSMPEIRGAIEAKLKADPKRSVHIRGDQDMPYKYFVEVMDLARQAGAHQINIVHEASKK